MAALAEADMLVRAATVSIEEIDPMESPAREAVNRYFAEIRDRFGFEATGLDAKDAAALRAPHGVFLVARSDGEPVACGGVQTIEPGVGEIKRTWVHSGWRGAGLGSRLLRELEGKCRHLGHHTVRLDTNQTLNEAIASTRRRAIDLSIAITTIRTPPTSSSGHCGDCRPVRRGRGGGRARGVP